MLNDRLFCWQQVERHDPLFRITHSFADGAIADRVLALNAFLAATGEICAMVSDEGVAARKLAWWRDEMNGGAGSGRPHPITSELRRSGAYDLLSPESLGRHFQAAAKRFDPAPLATRNELITICHGIGRPILEMEFAVCEAHKPGAPWIESMAARRGLLQLLREDLARRDYWWLPLDLMARYNLGRTDVRDRANSPSVRRLLTDAFECDEFRVNPKKEDISDINQSVKHIVFQDRLSMSMLRNRKLTSPDSWPGLLSKVSPWSVLMGWRAARRLNPWK